ncbi:MAG: phosphate ABC transporter substrate-binding protein PstS, partial [Verrucomicrobia bacterium]|nr:phosphate ABC transporter substrate-binding protein PstS [Verrucomicrobiota bacterium]
MLNLKSLFSLSVLGLTLLAVGHTTVRAQTSLTGAGATFPYPIYSKWFSDYKKVDPSVTFNYQSIGSGGGQKQISEGTVDFGASDGPMNDESLAKVTSGKILHIPTVAGAVVLTYNLSGVTDLKLDADTIAGIYLGKITKWNDAAIAKQNSGAKLPDAEIAVVHRADGSGTSYIYTDYLSTISADWKSKAGKGTSVSWPTGLGGKGNEGVTGQVKQTPNSIGYVELIYALQNKLSYAEVKNADGQYVKPTLESVTAALATANIPDDFRFSMVNAPGKDSYPIAGATWLLVYEQQKDAAKGKALVAFLKWALTEGEKQAKALDYAPLPDAEIAVVHRADGSGTSYIFTDYLSTISADWKSKAGKGTSVSWPTGLGGKGNEGVTG